MRGRLIKPFLAEISRLDVAGTASAGGYDPVFRTVRTTYTDGVRGKSSTYLEPIRLRCQVEQQTDRQQQQGPAGNVPEARLVLVFHFRELEQKDLLDASGNPLLRVNDRLDGIYTLGGVLVQKMVPVLYATEVQSGGFGIGLRRNLCLITFQDRPQGIR